MAKRVRFSPFGTAKKLFLERMGAAGDIPGDERGDFVGELMTRLRSFNLEEEMVQPALELVSWQSGLDLSEKRALLVVSLVSLVLLQQGSTRMPLDEERSDDYLADMVAGLLDGLQAEEGAQSCSAAEVLSTARRVIGSGRCSSIVGRDGEYKPLIVADGYLYHQKLRRLERSFVERVLRLLRHRDEDFGPGAAESCLSSIDGPFRLSEEQNRAVLAAVRNSFTIITGGPGTGKTSVVVAILRVLLELGVAVDDIALSAPTGKAANRMEESIRDAVSGLSGRVCRIADVRTRTLHRLLGYSPSSGRFRRHENNRLPEKFVLVDEASMIDLYLMERLIRSLRDDARLILLGDADQLPSVDAGSVFRDLSAGTEASGVEKGLAPYTVKLLRSHRMDEQSASGRHIYNVAKLIRDGVAAGLFDPQNAGGVVSREAAPDIAFEGVEFIDIEPGHRMDDLLEHWFRMQIANLRDFHELTKRSYGMGKEGFWARDLDDLALLYDHLNASKVLCLTRVFPTGSESVNRSLHLRFLEAAGQRSFTDFAPGEPVMMLRNDYERNIFNGDHGIVVRAHEKSGRSRLVAAFKRPDGYAAFPLNALRTNLEHSFAITVHKSQGSEFLHSAVLLPPRNLPILKREILYTAVTRSRKSVLLAGNKELLAAGVERALVRYSGISSLMEQAALPQDDSEAR